MIAGTEKKYEQAKESLERIQNFDASSLARKEELGEVYHFEKAVEPVRNLIDLYKRLSVTALEDFPDDILAEIQTQADEDHSKFKDILEFNPNRPDSTSEEFNPNRPDSTSEMKNFIARIDGTHALKKIARSSAIRKNLIAEVNNAYKAAFTCLHPYIAYSFHRSVDFQRLDTKARDTMQSVKEESEKLMGNLKEHENSAEKILEEVRQVAAEQGVSQQAIYFKKESEHHDEKAGWWLVGVFIFAVSLIFYTIGGLFLHKIPHIEPETIYDTIQLTVSKILIFSVIAYLLFLSVRNFLNHKHNAIINKHRQNALLTYQALVEASGDAGVRDAVLLQASSCIFSPQSTGYVAGHETDVSRQKSLVEILSKSATNTAQDVGK